MQSKNHLKSTQRVPEKHTGGLRQPSTCVRRICDSTYSLMDTALDVDADGCYTVTVRTLMSSACA